MRLAVELGADLELARLEVDLPELAAELAALADELAVDLELARLEVDFSF